MASPHPVAFLRSPLGCKPREPTQGVAVQRRTNFRNALVLGGSSGVGLNIVKYLRSMGAPVESRSRSNGYDISNPDQARSALETVAGGVALCIGAGRQKLSWDDEVRLYTNAAEAVAAAPNVSLLVAVVRSVVLPEVRNAFSRSVHSPWVILRPGPLIDFENQQASETSLLVTPDIRCNGLVSRMGVARVAGDLLLERIPIREVSNQAFGVYDEERMILKPSGCTFIGTDLWRNAKH